VDRHHAAGAEGPGGLGGLGAVQDQQSAAEEHGEAGGSGEEDGGVHRGEAFRDLLDGVERGVVAADVDAGQSLSGQHEADDLAGYRLDLLALAGAVDGGDPGDRDGAAVGARQFDGLPVGQALGVAAEALPAAGGGQGERDAGEESPAGGVEVVGVLVVREQHHVDGAEVGRGGGGGRGLRQRRPHRGVVPGGVERRVGQEAQAAVLEEGGRAAENADGELFGVMPGHSHSSRMGG
jgi:hypothetical protein